MQVRGRRPDVVKADHGSANSTLFAIRRRLRVP
jgi:hypothetical protein